MAENTLKEAVLYEPLENAKVRCNLCNWRCLIDEGKAGHCQVRENIGGKLYSLNNSFMQCLRNKLLPGTEKEGHIVGCIILNKQNQ